MGAPFYPHEHACAVLAGWREAMAAAPDEISSLAVCWSVPAQEPFPPELHGAPGVLVAGVYAGPVPDGEPVVAPLRELAQPLIDMSGPWPWLGLQSGFRPALPQRRAPAGP